jgi:Fe-S-cluster-containing dehydrogenase component
VTSCPVDALSTDEETGAVKVDEEKCTACGLCIDACPGKIPHLHPNRKYVAICDLCGGEPECAKICKRAGYMALFKGTRTPSINYDLYAKNPEEITNNLVINLYGEKGEEFI